MIIFLLRLALLFIFGSLSVIHFDSLVAGNVICTDISLCIVTNSSNVSIFDTNIPNISKSGSAVIVGSIESNRFTGGNLSDQILGIPGNDVIRGLEGDDELFGGTGNDEINGGLGEDNITGGEGNDTIYGDDGLDSIFGGPGDDLIVGGRGTDSIIAGDGDDIIFQGLFNSSESDGSQDIIYCGEGDDEVWINSIIDNDTANKDCEILHQG